MDANFEQSFCASVKGRHFFYEIPGVSFANGTLSIEGFTLYNKYGDQTDVDGYKFHAVPPDTLDIEPDATLSVEYIVIFDPNRQDLVYAIRNPEGQALAPDAFPSGEYENLFNIKVPSLADGGTITISYRTCSDEVGL